MIARNLLSVQLSYLNIIYIGQGYQNNKDDMFELMAMARPKQSYEFETTKHREKEKTHTQSKCIKKTYAQEIFTRNLASSFYFCSITIAFFSLNLLAQLFAHFY